MPLDDLSISRLDSVFSQPFIEPPYFFPVVPDRDRGIGVVEHIDAVEVALARTAAASGKGEQEGEHQSRIEVCSLSSHNLKICLSQRRGVYQIRNAGFGMRNGTRHSALVTPNSDLIYPSPSRIRYHDL